MNEAPFYGRKEKLERLRQLLKKKTSSLVVIKEEGELEKAVLFWSSARTYWNFCDIGGKTENGKYSKTKKFSRRPILIHVNGITDSVQESDFFCKNYRLQSVSGIKFCLVLFKRKQKQLYC